MPSRITHHCLQLLYIPTYSTTNINSFLTAINGTLFALNILNRPIRTQSGEKTELVKKKNFKIQAWGGGKVHFGPYRFPSVS